MLLAEEQTFLMYKTVFKIVARWRYDSGANARENLQNV